MTLNVVCLILSSFDSFHIWHFHFLFPFSLSGAYTASVSKRSPSPMTTQHHSALIVSLQLCLPTILLFPRIIWNCTALCRSDLICLFKIDYPRAGLTLPFFSQTTWGSRDGADDYDAERMKKRTDADRMKQPYYPQYLIKWVLRFSIFFYRRSISCSLSGIGLPCPIVQQGRTSSPLTWPFISWRNAVTTPMLCFVLDLPWFFLFFVNPGHSACPSPREYELRSGHALLPPTNQWV